MLAHQNAPNPSLRLPSGRLFMDQLSVCKQIRNLREAKFRKAEDLVEKYINAENIAFPCVLYVLLFLLQPKIFQNSSSPPFDRIFQRIVTEEASKIGRAADEHAAYCIGKAISTPVRKFPVLKAQE